MHLYLDDSVPAARLAAPALHIKAETAFAVAFCLCVDRGCKQIPNLVKYPCVCCRIRPWRPANRRLVNGNNLVKLFRTFYFLELSGYCARPVELLRQIFVQNLIDKGGFSGTGHACHTGKNTQRNFHVDLFEIVLRSTLYRQPSARLSSRFRYGNPQPAA